MIAGGSQALGSLGNTGMQIWQNDQNQHQADDMFNAQKGFAQSMFDQTNQFNLDMWQRQQSQNIANWNMANAYNSPSAQMQRFQAAGLNPNLIYGNMSNGPSIDAAQIAHASQASTPSQGATQGVTPKFDLSSGIMSYLGAQAQQAQIDNTKATTDATRTKALLDAATTAKTGAETSKTQLETTQFKNLMSQSLTAAQLANQKMAQDLTMGQSDQLLKIGAYNRDNTTALAGIQKARAEIANLNQQGQLSMSQQKLNQVDTVLKNMDVDLRKNGIMPHDSFIARYLGQLANKPISGYNIGNLIKGGESLSDLLKRTMSEHDDAVSNNDYTGTY